MLETKKAEVVVVVDSEAAVVEDLIEEAIVDLVEASIGQTITKVMVVGLNEALIKIQSQMLYTYREVEELVVVNKTIKMVLLFK